MEIDFCGHVCRHQCNFLLLGLCFKQTYWDGKMFKECFKVVAAVAHNSVVLYYNCKNKNTFRFLEPSHCIWQHASI